MTQSAVIRFPSSFSTTMYHHHALWVVIHDDDAQMHANVDVYMCAMCVLFEWCVHLHGVRGPPAAGARDEIDDLDPAQL